MRCLAIVTPSAFEAPLRSGLRQRAGRAWSSPSDNSGSVEMPDAPDHRCAIPQVHTFSRAESTTFDRITPEDEAFWSSHFRDVPLDWLADAVTPDAGCEKGRFAYWTGPRVRESVALDGSTAVLSAARNLADRDNCTVVHGDLLVPPLSKGAFNFVYCLGVLHHLPDPEKGFRMLVDLLSPGGLLFLYVYSRPQVRGLRQSALMVATMLRRLTTRLTHNWVRILSARCRSLFVSLSCGRVIWVRASACVSWRSYFLGRTVDGPSGASGSTRLTV